MQSTDIITADLIKKGYEAALIIDADPHLGEFCHPGWKLRSAVSGFGGSAGVLLVAKGATLLWVDARYWHEATELLAGTNVKVIHSTNTTDWVEWCASGCAAGGRICCDGRVISHTTFEKWTKLLANHRLRLSSRPTMYDRWHSIYVTAPKHNTKKTPHFELSEKLCGLSRRHKINTLHQYLKSQNATHMLIANLEDIAWLLNMRGWDIPYNQTFYSYLVLAHGHTYLFLDTTMLGPELRTNLRKDVTLHHYHSLYQKLRGTLVPKHATVLCDPATVSHLIFSAIARRGRKPRILQKRPHRVCIKSPLWPTSAKMEKTPAEIAAIRTSLLQEGLVYAQLNWRLLQNSTNITESKVVDMLVSLRKKRPHYLQDSFAAIVAHNANAAFIHYGKSTHSTAVLGDGVLLIDSGAHYVTGTTDTTRVLALGNVSTQMKQDYTKVLKALIALAGVRFPQGVTGRQLDSIARAVLWQYGDEYQHGTGHGVGFCLNVHEGPLSISPNAEPTPLLPGMVLSNEPGIYRAGEYGIRLENMVVVQPLKNNADVPNAPTTPTNPPLLGFETLTPCHLERQLVDARLLTKKEKEWYNQYQLWVYNSLKDHLSAEVCKWLNTATAPL